MPRRQAASRVRATRQPAPKRVEARAAAKAALAVLVAVWMAAQAMAVVRAEGARAAEATVEDSVAHLATEVEAAAAAVEVVAMVVAEEEVWVAVEV